MKADSNNSEKTPEAPQKRRPSVLLLDDDIDLCEALKATLEEQGYEVTAVHRGLEGVRTIVTRDYDVIVCDMMMPTMPGDMFYFAVQRLKPHLCSRFIFITGHQGTPKVDAFLSSVAARTLYKPLTIKKLLASIAETESLKKAPAHH